MVKFDDEDKLALAGVVVNTDERSNVTDKALGRAAMLPTWHSWTPDMKKWLGEKIAQGRAGWYEQGGDSKNRNFWFGWAVPDPDACKESGLMFGAKLIGANKDRITGCISTRTPVVHIHSVANEDWSSPVRLGSVDLVKKAILSRPPDVDLTKKGTKSCTWACGVSLPHFHNVKIAFAAPDALNPRVAPRHRPSGRRRSAPPPSSGMRPWRRASANPSSRPTRSPGRTRCAAPCCSRPVPRGISPKPPCSP